MKKIFFVFLLFQFITYGANSDWDSMPYISYNGAYPSETIRKGRNFELLQTLWEKPQSLNSLESLGFDPLDVDTTLLINQGMIYRKNNEYYSSIPFIDSLAVKKLRKQASDIAIGIIDAARPELEDYLFTLDSAGKGASAFSLVHSLVFDDLVWKYLGVSTEKATIHPVESMNWNGVYYFYRPARDDNYGTNGIRLDDNHKFKFTWGNNSNAYLCTVFTKSKILPALKALIKGESPDEKMIQDCIKFGVMNENEELTMPILDGKDEISKAGEVLAKAAGESFNNLFNGDDISRKIGWTADENDAALKVILYHEVLTELGKYLDESGLVPIPQILNSELPEDKKQTSCVAYISIR